MLKDGLTYPIEGDGALKNILIGGILLIFSWLLIPAFIAIGYLIKVGSTTTQNKDLMPAFGDWFRLLKRGFVGWVIAIAYAIIPLVLYAALAFLFLSVIGLGEAAQSEIAFGVGIIGIFILALLWMVIGALIYYTVPAALINYGSKNSIKAAFDFSTLKRIWFTKQYFIAALIPIFLNIIQSIIIAILGITLIGWVLVPFIAFYFQVAIFRIFGLAIREVGGRSGL
ncbi:DUF4013 domain-containing protein [Methanonatronarchaeum sp. AMET6-2]|uniref:DUF4013 domain-containing protein n=1 Tax=Methanonatronarchaeum sp. AMET6-2 TaxID=2933293 RepID=UPI0011FCE511|nr:DUF4013 domain-containing protein [Methanonatronarchaeum sp. AMET6-2]RZN60864.1 MAG: DUF4013 domain-containing protein [Methanonatronarchaeia archaeon]UOY09562.1 DUF4013 domain-containing protein [Methanonatronarchaeum sp. AMET6-2]